jgi:hypothetical protein
MGACLVAAVWLCIPTDVGGGGKDKGTPSAESIVGKALAFHGGLKALGRDVAIVRNEESEMVLEGDKITLKCDWEYQPPDKRAFQATVKIGGLTLRVLYGMAGGKGWMKIGPAPAVDLSPEQVAGMIWEHRSHVRAVQLLAGAEKYFDIGAPRAARLGDRDVWAITATSRETKLTLTAFFDKTTGQVLGNESDRVLPTLGAENSREKPATYVAIYKTLVDVDGMKMPETMRILRDGTPVVEVKKAQVRVVESIDPKLFEKPK